MSGWLFNVNSLEIQGNFEKIIVRDDVSILALGEKT